MHPPLDYALDKLAMPLFSTAEAERALTVLWGAASVAVFGELVRRRAGARAALFSMAFLALAPAEVRTAQTLRPYALGLLLLSASLVALDAALRDPRGRRLLAFSVLAAAAALTLYIAALALAIAGIAMIAEDRLSGDPARAGGARRLIRLLPAAASLPAAALLLWLAPMRFALFRPGAPPLHGRAWTPARLERLVAGWSISGKMGGWSYAPRFLFLAGLLALAALSAAGLAACIRKPGARFLVAWLAGTVAAVFALSRVFPFPAGGQYFSMAAPAFLAIAGAGAASLFSRRPLPGAVLALVFVAAQLRGIASYFAGGRYDWAPAIRVLSASPPAEPVIVDNARRLYPAAYYLCGPTWLARRDCGGRRIVSLGGDAARLAATCGDRPAWLAVGGEPDVQRIRDATSGDPTLSFPEAEGILLRRLPPCR